LQANELVGSAMTYTLFEYAKDNVNELMPDNLLCSSTVQVEVSGLLFDCFVFYILEK